MTELPARYVLPIKLDFPTVKVGDTKRFRIVLTETEAAFLSDIDFTGANFTFLCEIAQDKKKTTTEKAVVTVTAPEPNVLEVLLPDAESAKLLDLVAGGRPANAVWDLQITQVNPRYVFTLFEGIVPLTPDVSRASA